MPEWHITTIGDVLTLQRGIDITKAEQRPGSVPVVSSGGISSYHDTAAVSGPGVVIGRKGALGTTFYLDSDYWPHDTTLWVKDFKGSHPRFVYYFFANLDVKGLDVGSANPTLNRNHVHPLAVRWPGRSEQERIAAALGALDDKIGVNDRIAAVSDDLTGFLLESIIAEDNALSEVPLSDVAVVNCCKVTPAIGGYVRYIDISSVSAGSVDWPLRIPWSEAPSRARRGVSVGDTIWSTVRPGRRSYALILEDDPELVVSTGFAVLTPVKVGAAFLYEVTKRNEFVQYLESVSEGSAYPAVRAERFEQAVIPLLSQTRLREFEAIVMPLRRQISAKQAESRLLAELRDSLLPRLMSGEIRVREAERVVEEAM
jgi:type I restriction enzyme, S subunit